jgi:hypothetical protein
VRSLSVDAFSWHRGGPYLVGGVLLAAAIYRLTPAKEACLRRCRGPVRFLTEAWCDGPLGALRLGIEHGAWCIGCCWALMAALFALGVMSISWMLLIAALIAIEKLAPWKVSANLVIALAVAGLGLAVALVPSQVPGLTLPSSAPAEHVMSTMNGRAAMDGRQGGGTMTNESVSRSARCSTAGRQRRRARSTTSAMCAVPGGGSIRGSIACSSTVNASPTSRAISSALT